MRGAPLIVLLAACSTAEDAASSSGGALAARSASPPVVEPVAIVAAAAPVESLEIVVAEGGTPFGADLADVAAWVAHGATMTPADDEPEPLPSGVDVRIDIVDAGGDRALADALVARLRSHHLAAIARCIPSGFFGARTTPVLDVAVRTDGSIEAVGSFRGASCIEADAARWRVTPPARATTVSLSIDIVR